MPAQPVVYLSRRETFAVSHRLHSKFLSDEENKRVYGKCNHANGHGHNYMLEVTLKSPVDAKTGMVINLVDMEKIIWETVGDKIDHRYVNLDVEEFKEINPTVENMSVVVWGWLKNSALGQYLHEIKLYETEKNFATYRGE